MAATSQSPKRYVKVYSSCATREKPFIWEVKQKDEPRRNKAALYKATKQSTTSFRQIRQNRKMVPKSGGKKAMLRSHKAPKQKMAIQFANALQNQKTHTPIPNTQTNAPRRIRRKIRIHHEILKRTKKQSNRWKPHYYEAPQQ